MHRSALSAKSVSDKIAWKALQNLVRKFNFNEIEGMTLLGDMKRSSYYKGISKHEGGLSRDEKERISLLLGIYKDLRTLFVDSAQGMSWIDRQNSLAPFKGITPREYLMEGSLMRLAEVRRFLDFWRGY
ncbi:MAG: DUF2384 domain-containing protein [Gammaproteobacteria bacterium]|nr:DUF2384 domain-containing protein [Gammaproteobacteria bacterium]